MIDLLSVLAVAASVAGSEPATAPGPDFAITYQDQVPQEARTGFQAAADIWSGCLASEVPIRIHVVWIDRGPSGFAQTRHVRGADHLPVKNADYPASLANALAGVRDGDKDDMNLFFSARVAWYFGPEDGIGDEEKDFINVALHEIAHGLGIESATYIPWEGEPIASLGLPNPWSNYFTLTFERGPQDGTPVLYDTFVRLADGRGLRDFENPSLALTKALANPTLHFAGENAVAANGGYPVGVTPRNISHRPDPFLGANPIMLANSGVGETVRRPDAVLLGMLEDLGWTITDQCKTIDAPE